MFLLCSIALGSSRRRSDGAQSPRRWIFDIVYPTTPNGTDRRPNPLAPKNHPVNFLYMGSFLRFKKNRSQFLTYA